jgi:hypothetical protein
MEQREKKINIALDINKELQKQLSNSKLIKYSIYSLTIIGGIISIGFLAKVFNYTLKNMSELNKTLKQ